MSLYTYFNSIKQHILHNRAVQILTSATSSSTTTVANRLISKDHSLFTGDASSIEYGDYLNNVCLVNPHVFIEITSICNFFCFYCNSSDSKRKQHMNDKVFYRVLEQLHGLTTNPIRLHCDGEPTINKNFYKYANAINNKGYKIELVSNGSGLKDKFVDLNMNLTINLSTNNNELSKRSKISFDKYIGKLIDYVATWYYKATNQNIVFNIYLSSTDRSSKERRENIVDFVNYFISSTAINAQLNRENISNDTLIHVANQYNCTLSINYMNIASGGLYPETEKAKRIKLSRDHGFCDSPWKRMVILADGSVQACCIDLSGSLAYSKPEEICTTSLSDLWLNHELVNKYRSDFLHGNVTHETCRKCLDRVVSREFYTRYSTPFDTNN